MNDFKYLYFQKCAELRVPPILAIINLVHSDNFDKSASDTLDLNNKRLTDQDMAPIVSALEECTSVKNLILSQNQIKDLNRFIKLFQTNRSLEGVDLSDNPFDEDKGNELVALLSTKTNVKWFNITKSDPEKKLLAKTHRQTDSLCTQKSSARQHMPPSSSTFRTPLPHKPKETPGHISFRSSLYQGPNSARTTWRQKDEPEAQKPKEDNKVSQQRDNQEIEEKDETKPQEYKTMLLPRTEWILKMKNIFSKLVNEFEETLFHKALIMKRVREEAETFVLPEKPTSDNLNFDKGYSVDQVLEALESSEESYLRYDDIIEIICNLDKPKNTHSSIDSTSDSNVNLTKNDPTLSLIEGQPPSLYYTSPIQHMPGALDYVECSFSIDNQALGESKYAVSKDVNKSKKPPKIMPKARDNSLTKRHIGESPLRDNYLQQSDFEGRPQVNSNSPTEIETARFHRDINQDSEIKEKAEPSKLEISAELSHLHDMEAQNSQSLLLDIENTLNGLDTTAKLMSALGEIPDNMNISNLNTYNFLLERLAIDTNMTSFTISEKTQTPESTVFQGTVKQLFDNKFFQYQESEPLSNQLNDTNVLKNKRVNNLAVKNENYSNQMEANAKSNNPKEIKKLPLENMDINKKILKKEDSLELSNSKDQIKKQTPEKSNVSRFEKILESVESVMLTNPTEETFEILNVIDCFKIHREQEHPIVSFFYDGHKTQSQIPYNNKTFKEILSYIEAIKLINIINLSSKISNILNENLKILNISNNNLLRADFFGSCKNLEFLNISNNKLKDLSSITSCSKLKEIYLDSNRLSQLPNFVGLDFITIISAPSNLIDTLGNIANLTLNKKLLCLDLRGNPVTNNPNYHSLVKNILPKLKALDTNGSDFSQYKSFNNICFGSDQPQIPSPEKISHQEPKAQPSKKVRNPLSHLELMPNERNTLENLSQMSMELSESDINEEVSLSRAKKPKSQVPKLNIENLQPMDLMSLNSTGAIQKKHPKVGIDFQNLVDTESKRTVERPQSSNQSPDKMQHQFRRKSTGNKKLALNFLSQRDHDPNKFTNIHMKNGTGPVLHFKNFLESSDKYISTAQEKITSNLLSSRLDEELLGEGLKQKKNKAIGNKHININSGYEKLKEKFYRYQEGVDQFE